LSNAYLVYPVAGLLTLAASVPFAAPSLFFDQTPATVSSSTSANRVVVATTKREVEVAPVAPNVLPGGAPSDDRWWRTQMQRVMTTTSVVNLPPPAPAPSVPQQRPAPVPPDRVEAAAPSNARPVEQEVRLSPQVPAAIRRWEPLILKAAKKHEVDPNLLAALMQTESNGNPNAVSWAGAIGLMQVMDGPADPEANIDAGAKMLKSNLKRFGSIDLALAAYNAGVGSVLESGGVPPFEETRNHIARTLASYTAWKA
jgi:soluble lytic murein transglycosylase-like protein